MIGDNLTGDALYAYTAGIIDGEGNINIYRVTSPEDKPRYAMRIAVGSTEPWLPEFLKSKFGGNVYLRPSKTKAHKDCWIWTVAAKKATPLLNKILPYLCLKHEQAELALQFQSRRKNRHILMPQEKILDAADKILMMSYNRKGQKTKEVC
ncbi:MAG: hypothetical protein WC455_19700 [Dehalococcoidia bacterium]